MNLELHTYFCAAWVDDEPVRAGDGHTAGKVSVGNDGGPDVYLSASAGFAGASDRYSDVLVQIHLSPREALVLAAALTQAAREQLDQPPAAKEP